MSWQPLGDSAGAAIALGTAAERYGLEIVAADIQDADDNVTRFAVLVAADAEPPAPAGPMAPIGGDRETLLTFETGHRPGDLYRALGAFADAGINLSRIESRPSGEGPWRYRFLVQVSGDADDRAAARRAGPDARTHDLDSRARLVRHRQQRSLTDADPASQRSESRKPRAPAARDLRLASPSRRSSRPAVRTSSSAALCSSRSNRTTRAH